MLKLTLLTLSLAIMLTLALAPTLQFQFNLQVGGGAVHLGGYTRHGVCYVGWALVR